MSTDVQQEPVEAPAEEPQRRCSRRRGEGPSKQCSRTAVPGRKQCAECAADTYRAVARHDMSLGYGLYFMRDRKLDIVKVGYGQITSRLRHNSIDASRIIGQPVKFELVWSLQLPKAIDKCIIRAYELEIKNYMVSRGFEPLRTRPLGTQEFFKNSPQKSRNLRRWLKDNETHWTA